MSFSKKKISFFRANQQISLKYTQKSIELAFLSMNVHKKLVKYAKTCIFESISHTVNFHTFLAHLNPLYPEQRRPNEKRANGIVLAMK